MVSDFSLRRELQLKKDIEKAHNAFIVFCRKLFIDFFKNTKETYTLFKDRNCLRERFKLISVGILKIFSH